MFDFKIIKRLTISMYAFKNVSAAITLTMIESCLIISPIWRCKEGSKSAFV